MQISSPETGRIGAVITDLDPDGLSPEDAVAIKQLVYEHKLVVLRGIKLSRPEYVAFARRFGRPQVYFQDHYHHPDHPEIFVSSNQPEKGQKVGVAGTGRFWHSDYQFFDVPLSTTMVYPQVVPKTLRSTFYIDMVRVLADLPDDLRAYLTPGRRAFHDATNYYKIQPTDIDRPIIDLIREFREQAPGAWHPLVIEHPVTHEKSLYISEGFTTGIENMSHEECAEVLPRFFEFVDQPQYRHEHPWRTDDILFWDNRTLIHHASENPNGEPSVSYRIGVYDDLPFYVAPAEAPAHAR